jgi:TetR/AcrR family transcriptional regulator, transcriptional repressor for nem operon
MARRRYHRLTILNDDDHLDDQYDMYHTENRSSEMGYSQQHKAETRAKLLRLASVTLREDGPDKLGVIELMRTAGLTHGGFYAHFKSREALLIEALKTVFDEAQQRYHKISMGVSPREALAKFIDQYLSPAHRDALSACPIVTLNSDLPRQPQAFRAAYRAGVKKLVGIIAGWIEAAGIADDEALAASVLADMAGAIALSRSVADKRLSNNLLNVARRRIKAQLDLRVTL